MAVCPNNTIIVRRKPSGRLLDNLQFLTRKLIIQEILVKSVNGTFWRDQRKMGHKHLKYKAKSRGTSHFEYQLLAYLQGKLSVIFERPQKLLITTVINGEVSYLNK